VNFLDAWMTLAPLALALRLAPAALVALSVLLPGRGVARLAALGVALWVPVAPVTWPAEVRAGWGALWLVVAWRAGRRSADAGGRRARVGAMVESGVVGLAVGLALLVVVLAAVARADLAPEDSRRVAAALLLLGFGLVHLMVRRRARRATLSFAALGLALQGLADAARAAQGPLAPPPDAAALVAATAAVALAEGVSLARERYAGTDLVALSHDLHD
jgi:hypothetical protein